jgi:hypothetical protein
VGSQFLQSQEFVFTPEGEENVASSVDGPQALIAGDCGFHWLKAALKLSYLEVKLLTSGATYSN